jgi:hypothetical protein
MMSVEPPAVASVALALTHWVDAVKVNAGFEGLVDEVKDFSSVPLEAAAVDEVTAYRDTSSPLACWNRTEQKPVTPIAGESLVSEMPNRRVPPVVDGGLLRGT